MVNIIEFDERLSDQSKNMRDLNSVISTPKKVKDEPNQSISTRKYNPPSTIDKSKFYQSTI